MAQPLERPEIINAVADALVAQAALENKNRLSLQMRSINTRLEELHSVIAARQKTIEQIRGQSEVPIMRERHAVTQNSLATLTNAMTSLRIRKAEAQAGLTAFEEAQRAGKIKDSSDIQSAVANDPEVIALRAALLQAEITLLGDKSSKQLLTIHRSLKDMLEARIAEATTEAVNRRLIELKREVAAVSEQTLSVGNQYLEESQRLRDLGASLSKIEQIQAEMDRLGRRRGELETQLLRMRIDLDIHPLSVWSPAEITD